nr:glycine-rich cell wall structural protein 1.0-like [Aegilops tauschii subsp. strangulata]
MKRSRGDAFGLVSWWISSTRTGSGTRRTPARRRHRRAPARGRGGGAAPDGGGRRRTPEGRGGEGHAGAGGAEEQSSGGAPRGSTAGAGSAMRGSGEALGQGDQQARSGGARERDRQAQARAALGRADPGLPRPREGRRWAPRALAARGAGEGARDDVARPHGGAGVAGRREGTMWRTRIGPGCGGGVKWRAGFGRCGFQGGERLEEGGG